MNPSNRLANPFLRPSPFAGNLAAGSTAYELHPPRPSKTYEPAYKYQTYPKQPYQYNEYRGSQYGQDRLSKQETSRDYNRIDKYDSKGVKSPGYQRDPLMSSAGLSFQSSRNQSREEPLNYQQRPTVKNPFQRDKLLSTYSTQNYDSYYPKYSAENEHVPSYNPFRVSTADTYGLKTPVYEDTKNSDYDHRLKAVEKYSNALNETLKNGKYEAGSTDYKWKKNKWKVQQGYPTSEDYKYASVNQNMSIQSHFRAERDSCEQPHSKPLKKLTEQLSQQYDFEAARKDYFKLGEQLLERFEAVRNEAYQGKIFEKFDDEEGVRGRQDDVKQASKKSNVYDLQEDKRREYSTNGRQVVNNGPKLSIHQFADFNENDYHNQYDSDEEYANQKSKKYFGIREQGEFGMLNAGKFNQRAKHQELRQENIREADIRRPSFENEYSSIKVKNSEPSSQTDLQVYPVIQLMTKGTSEFGHHQSSQDPSTIDFRGHRYHQVILY